MLKWILPILVLLTGCASTEPPEKPVSEMTRCEAVRYVLGNDFATPAQQAAALEMGRNYGCFGPAQTQHLEVTVK